VQQSLLPIWLLLQMAMAVLVLVDCHCHNHNDGHNYISADKMESKKDYKGSCCNHKNKIYNFG
jgi:hypothetical protein